MKKSKISVVLLMCVLLFVLNGCGLFGSREPDTQTIPETVTGEDKQDVSEPDEGSISATEKTDYDGGAQGYFTTADLNGNTVTQEIFTQSDLTVVNVWATYCGPCIMEMPYLGELADEYDSARVQIVGIPSDVYNQEYQEYALSLVEETGADYMHLLVSEELYNWGLSDIQYVPTTFFINSKGEIIDTIVGSKTKEEWKKLIDDKLASL